jgi:glucan endo-1,6-beta-glucosidase
MLVSLLASLAALGSASPLDTRQSTPAAYCSNSNGQYKLSSISAPVKGAGSPGSESTWVLNIDDTSSGHKQTITGFGAAVTDATVAVFNQLSSSTLNTLLSELMTSAGAGFSLFRHSIGASDLSADPAYSYDDNGGSADTSLSSFNLGDRGTAMAQMLAKMKSLNSNLNVLGSPWSPPGWMKLNNAIDGQTTNNNLNDGYLTSGGTGSTGYASQFAQYFVKYIQAFQAQGATINAITLQNEPLNSQSGYPTMYMFDWEQTDLINKYVGPALANAGLGGTKIWAYDHNTGNRPFLLSKFHLLTQSRRRAFVSADCRQQCRPVCQHSRLALLRKQPELGCAHKLPQLQSQRRTVHDGTLAPLKPPLSCGSTLVLEDYVVLCRRLPQQL